MNNLREDALNGLNQPQKTLPGKYLWDERGSEIFERITARDDYYPTRASYAYCRDASARSPT